MNLQTMTPVEVDTMLAALYAEQNKVGTSVARATDTVMRAGGARRTYGRGNSGWSMTQAEAEAKARATAADETAAAWTKRDAEKAVEALDAARAALAQVHAEQARIGEEFTRRGGWTRAFLVTDGHVHSSMNCSTCNNGEYPTVFTWLVEFSGGTEADVVEAAASRACTVCYPSAPVETAGESRLMTPDERTRAEQREAAAKAKVERQAAKVAKGLTADGSEFVVSYPGTRREQDRVTRQYVEVEVDRREYFKTERAAVQWVVQYAAWSGWDCEKAPAFTAVVEAVAAKHGKTVAEVRADLQAKVAAKIKRDNR